MPVSPRLRSAATLITLGLLSACSEIVAPIATKVQRAAADVTNLVTCTNNWVLPQSGSWSDASNWSAHAVPTAADNVCILAEGNYTVTMLGLASVNSVTIGRPGNVDKPKLTVLSSYTFSSFQEINSRLTVANGIDNYGWLELNSEGPANSGGSSVFIDGGTFYNHDISSFRILPGANPSASHT